MISLTDTMNNMGGNGPMITIAIISGTCVLVVTTIYRWIHKPLRIIQSIGVPIAKGYKPLLGHVLEGSKFENLGDALISNNEKYGKVYCMTQFRLPVLVVSDPEMLKEILIRQFNSFTDRSDLPLRDWMKQSLLDLNGGEWKRIRTMLTPFFSSGKLKAHSAVMRHCSDILLEKLNKISSDETSNSFCARRLSEQFTLDVICGSGYGLTIDSQNNPDHPLVKTLKLISNISLLDPKFLLAAMFPALETVMSGMGLSMFPSGYLKFFESIVRQMIDERRKTPGEREDFLETLMRAEEEYLKSDNKNGGWEHKKGLDNKELLAQALIFFIAGYDTTAGGLSWLMYNLALHPDVQTKLHAEIQQHIAKDERPNYDNVQKLQYLDCCIDESLRLYPATFFFDRVATEDVTVMGIKIPKGTDILVPVWAIHRDPQIWPEPNKFNPDRFFEGGERQQVDEFSLLQFGAGQRACIGARFAKIEIKIALVDILKKFELKSNEKTEVPLKLIGQSNVFVQPMGGVWLSAVPRKS